ncbi:Zinc finger protein 155 [Araneus ventricosus]|uniref:Zinc finger protein 155 n=1 Tax=Araneus ventricosus TaxID=182803 RepID=A0A4Y2MHH0_ARAVE|nr:Zinc finger protein 155 [Araneus ventricosus]GBN60522.1 Zinc finger protein 155 [Araneus ventricosus]GBN60553.1 Zinc finger protein 155 [Araneus ventricosus]
MAQVHISDRSFPGKVCSEKRTESGRLMDDLVAATNEMLTDCEISEEFDSNVKVFEWETYGKTLSDGKNLNSHLCKTEKPFICKVCRKTFSYRSALKSHFLIHTDEKSYVCEICSKAFKRNGSLKFHLLTHTKEKPYACEICSKAFMDKRNLKSHLVTHTKEKPYVVKSAVKHSRKIAI